MESAMVPAIYDPSIADEDLRVDSERAYEMVRRLAREEGLLVGISSGAALAVMLQVAQRLERGVRGFGISRRRGEIPHREILGGRCLRRRTRLRAATRTRMWRRRFGVTAKRRIRTNAAARWSDGTAATAAVVALPNTTEEGPRRRFLVRPSDYRMAEQRAGELGGELLGFYHSHPDHPARPSQYDLDHAWPTFAYVIVAVAAGAATDMTVWYLKDDRTTFEKGELHGDENPDSDTASAVHG